MREEQLASCELGFTVATAVNIDSIVLREMLTTKVKLHVVLNAHSATEAAHHAVSPRQRRDALLPPLLQHALAHCDVIGYSQRLKHSILKQGHTKTNYPMITLYISYVINLSVKQQNS